MKRLAGPAVALWNRLHPTVAATLAGLLCAGLLRAAGQEALVARLDFTAVLLRWLLPFLLFAGALHLAPRDLREEGGFIALLSSAGVVISTVAIGWTLRRATAALGRDIPTVECLLFGALISPTDPVAVLAIFRRAQAPRPLSVIIGAESLFNDGFAVAAFLSVLGAEEGQRFSLSRAALLFLRQTGGGLLFGLALGAAAAYAVRNSKSLPLRLFFTAVLALGGYSAANALGVSGLLAVIVAGIWVGGRDLALKARWVVIDEALNLTAFFLLGLSALKVPYGPGVLWLGALAIPVVLAGRAASVAASMAALRPWRSYVPGTFRALTWGGLRGAIPLALALGLPESPYKPLLVLMTYGVALFSLVVQGSTI